MNTATAAIARKNTATQERELRATVAALPAAYLAMLGLNTPAAIEAYIAAEMSDEA